MFQFYMVFSKRLSDQQESQGGMDRFEEPGQEGGENADETVDRAKDKDKKTNDTEKLRLCNGEIFFILNVSTVDSTFENRTLVKMSNGDIKTGGCLVLQEIFYILNVSTVKSLKTGH